MEKQPGSTAHGGGPEAGGIEGSEGLALRLEALWGPAGCGRGQQTSGNLWEWDVPLLEAIPELPGHASKVSLPQLVVKPNRHQPGHRPRRPSRELAGADVSLYHVSGDSDSTVYRMILLHNCCFCPERGMETAYYILGKLN